MFPFSRAAAAGSWQALSASPSKDFSRFISALISSTSLLSPLNSWRAVPSSSSVADFFKLASWTVSTMIFSTSSFDTTLHSSTFWLLQRGFGTGFSGEGGLGLILSLTNQDPNIGAIINIDINGNPIVLNAGDTITITKNLNNVIFTDLLRLECQDFDFKPIQSTTPIDTTTGLEFEITIKNLVK